MRRHPALGSGPSDLFRDVGQLGSIQVGVHGLGFETHGGDRELFIDNAGSRMIKDQLVDRSIDLLTDMATEALAAFAACRGQLFHPLLLQTGAEFRLAPPLLSVTFVPLGQLAMKGSVLVARRG